MAQWQQDHPIFRDIDGGILEEVQRRVRADAAVLEERRHPLGMTPLIHAIRKDKPVIALWLIEHRGQHDLDTGNNAGGTALHYACQRGLLPVVHALVVAGANPAVLDGNGATPLMWAATTTPPSWPSSSSSPPSRPPSTPSTAIPLLPSLSPPTVVTFPSCSFSTRVPTPPSALAVPEARNDSADEGNGEPQAVQQQQQQQEAIAAAPAYLKERVAEGRELPAVEVVVDDDSSEEEEELVACVKYALGLEGGTDFSDDGGRSSAPRGMVHDVFIELCELLVPAWDRAHV